MHSETTWKFAQLVVICVFLLGIRKALSGQDTSAYRHRVFPCTLACMGPIITDYKKSPQTASKRKDEMGERQFTPKEVLEQMRKLKELGAYIEGDITSEGPQADLSADLLYEQWLLV